LFALTQLLCGSNTNSHKDYEYHAVVQLGPSARGAHIGLVAGGEKRLAEAVVQQHCHQHTMLGCTHALDAS
jgi:hypothetical protein